MTAEFDLFHRNAPGRFFRGNVHTHSIASDGGMTAESVCRAYAEQGYDFMALTDHFLPEYDYPVVDTTPYRNETFTTLIGAELHAPALANGQIWHMLALGLPLDFPAPSPDETGADLGQRAIEAGAFLVLAHPAWYGATVADLQSIPGAHAIEIYNEVCGRLNDRAESWYLCDQVLASGRHVLAVGGDDAHFRHNLAQVPDAASDVVQDGIGEDAPAGFGCWVWVRAASLQPGAIVDALKAGDFYTSQGPAIHDVRISADRTRIEVVNSPTVSVYATGDPAIVSVYGQHGLQITHWSAPIEQFHGSYVRVTIVDAAGKRAWSNPIWLD